MDAVFDLFVTYSQLAVFDPDLEDPMNDWSDVHAAQGFTWRPGSVSFGTLVDSYPLRVEVRYATEIDLIPNTIRAIVVPFIVPTSGRLGLSDMVQVVETTMPPGPYALAFETGFRTGDPEDGTWVRLSFIPQEAVEASILIADEGLNPPETLDMHAVPAV